MRGLKIWTFCRPIWARRSRRMSSSLLPLNMLPVMTSIQPAWARRMSSTIGLGPRRTPSGSALVLARLGVDADHVAGVDERRAGGDEAGRAGRRAGRCDSPDSVWRRPTSPGLMNDGTVMTKPVSQVAGLVCADAVAPLM